MRKEFAVKPIALPQPVFIIGTYDKDGTPNAMNAAWGCHNEMDQMMFALAKGHKTVKNLLETKAFTVSMGTVEQLAACDYVGPCKRQQGTAESGKGRLSREKSPSRQRPVL